MNIMTSIPFGPAMISSIVAPTTTPPPVAAPPADALVRPAAQPASAGTDSGSTAQKDDKRREAMAEAVRYDRRGRLGDNRPGGVIDAIA